MATSMWIEGDPVDGAGPPVHGVDPSTGERLAPGFGGAEPADVERACAAAARDSDAYRALPLARRAALLEAIAAAIEAIGDTLIERAMAETGLPRARLEGERGRTTGQLRLFASVVRAGLFLQPRIDHADPARTPAPRPDLRLRMLPVGPVAVFGASNFPLAFSVAGGDTAAALAAGCPVLVKAHPAHPGTSALVGAAVARAVTQTGMPAGVFALLFDAGHAVGGWLVADPRIKAVGFTGSRGGGLALMAIAAARHEPIPVYAEMSSVNPVLVMPGALAAGGEAIARGLVASLTLGAGQFCTSPGLVFAIDGPGFDPFADAVARYLSVVPAAVMLTPAMLAAFRDAVAARGDHPRLALVGRGGEAGLCTAQAAVFVTDAAALRDEPALTEEVFGAASLIVRCADAADLAALLEVLEGQLTVAVHAADADLADVAALMPVLERRAGRILFGGFGTGVEVAHAMVHGGPFPATSDGRSTSVGSLAIDRFLRPVCYQDVPAALLADELRDDNPLGLDRLVDGRRLGGGKG